MIEKGDLRQQIKTGLAACFSSYAGETTLYADRAADILLEIIEREKRKAVEEAKLDMESFEIEKQLIRANAKHHDLQVEALYKLVCKAIEGVETIDYQTAKEKAMVKNAVIAEYFRVMRSLPATFPPTHE